MPMKTMLKLAACAAILTAAACGDQRGSDGLTGDEREKLNKAAEDLDQDVVDASPDSLVAEGAESESNEAVDSEGAAENSR